MSTRRARGAAVLLLAGLCLAGCRSSSGTASRENSTAAAAAPWSGRVLAVLDGDTIDVDHNGTRERVRLLSIDAPEIAHDGRPADCGGDATRSHLDRRVWHRQVTVATDTTADRTDRYGRTLAYVYVGQLDAGLDQVTSGYAGAWHPTSSPAPSRQRTYQLAQEKAQQQRAGSWSTCRALGRQSGDR